jgi:SAM-dependent methyltransferase
VSIPDFSGVTEIPGGRATAEQLSMMLTRYRLAAQHAQSKNVLEVACGAGMGLGYLARTARRVVGGDIDAQNLAHAATHYAGNAKVDVLRFDAQRMPFADASFDVVLLYEAIYYLPDAAAFAAEARRVLRPGGVFIVSTVNREWAGFNPSPHSVRYYSAGELRELLGSAGFSVRIHAAFRDEPGGLVRGLIGTARRVAVRFHLIPKTMRGKDLLKRLFYGRLSSIGHEIEDGQGRIEPLVELAEGAVASTIKMLYAVGHCQNPVTQDLPRPVRGKAVDDVQR